MGLLARQVHLPRSRQVTYLIFVFFHTGKNFGEQICTEKRVNYDKPILRQNSVNRDLLGQANNNRV